VDGESNKSTNDGLTRKIELLEDELDAAEKNVKETVDKCVPSPFHLCRPSSPSIWQTPTGRCQSGAL
jgi:Tropomyosin like